MKQIRELTPFGKQVEMRRRQLGITQAQLAEIIGTHQSAISNYCNGTRECKLAKHVAAFAKFLNLTIEETYILIKQPRQSEYIDLESTSIDQKQAFERHTLTKEYMDEIKGRIQRALSSSPLNYTDISIAFELICDALDEMTK